MSIQPEAPPHREEETAGQKSSAHSLFTQISTTGFGLGRTTPETNLDLFHGTYQSSLTTRQGVFRHLTGVYNCKPEDKGFHLEERDTDWGRQTFAIGRTQRDWLKNRDMVPRLHPISPSSPFYSLCLQEAHRSSLSPELAELYLASLNNYLPCLSEQLPPLPQLLASTTSPTTSNTCLNYLPCLSEQLPQPRVS